MMVDENKDELPPSKSQRKRDMHALQAMGGKLTELNEQRLAEIPLTERLREAIREYKRIHSHEAKRRQLQFIGRLMQNEEVEPIKEALAKLENLSVQAAKELHDIENWRTNLLSDTKSALTQFIDLYPGCDVQRLRHLIKEAKSEKETSKPAGAGRALFRYLREIAAAS